MSPATRPEGVVVIPALNEESRLGRVIEGVRRCTRGLDVLVVDDGSGDATAAVAREHGADVLSHPFNLGYGAALQTGYKRALQAGYAHLVQMDADGQHDPADIERLLAPLRDGTAD